MAIDTPATIAIIGAGPIGLEAALYARYLGYDVLLFERGSIAANVGERGADRLAAPFGANCSKLGLAALHAQDPRWRPPDAGASLTGDQWRTAYLLPLAQSDLLIDTLREPCEVIEVETLLAADEPGAEELPDGLGPEELAGAGPDDEEPLPPNFIVHFRRAGAAAAETVPVHVIIDASGAHGPVFERSAANYRAAAEDSPGLRAMAPTYRTIAADFYSLGAKSFATSETQEFSFVTGLQQIRELFALLMDRAALDLYATMDKLLP